MQIDQKIRVPHLLTVQRPCHLIRASCRIQENQRCTVQTDGVCRKQHLRAGGCSALHRRAAAPQI